MYILKKELPNIPIGTELEITDKRISEITKDEKLKKEWLVEKATMEKIAEDDEKEIIHRLENEKDIAERNLAVINQQLFNLLSRK